MNEPISSIEGFRAEATKIQHTLDERVAATLADDRLSDAGKREHLESWQNVHDMAVTRLQSEYRQWSELERRSVDRKLTKIRAERFAHQRDVLGDAVLVDVTLRKMQYMDASEILGMVTDASPGFEVELLRELAAVWLWERRDTWSVAHQQLQDAIADDDTELRRLTRERDELDAFDIADLDVAGYRERFAEKFGFDVRHVASVT